MKGRKLPKGKKGRLFELNENQQICEILIRNYDPENIKRSIELVDKKIKELQLEKERIIVERLTPSEQKLVELRRRLRDVKKEQRDIKLNPNILVKLAKAVKVVKEIENFVKA